MKKRILAIVLGVAMTLSMVGCGSKEQTPATTPDKTPEASTEEAPAASAESNDYHFEVIVKSFQSTYWQAAVQGINKACEELGVTANANGPANESDIPDQVQMLDDAIQKAPDGIGLAACDTNSVLDSLTKALEAGIPVVCFDTGVSDAPEGAVVATVATDNEAAGACAATNMYPVIKDLVAAATADKPVRIGEVNQDATAQNIQQRGGGFIDKMIELLQADGKTVAVAGNEFYVNAATTADATEADADVVIQVAVPAQTTVELCSNEAQAILSKENCIAIFGSNQTAAEGVLAANANLNVLGSDAANGDVIGVGFDAGSIIKAAVQDGTFLGAVTQSPLMMGYYAIYALTAAANGQELEDVPTDGYWYDSTNMDDEEIAPNLYD